MLSNMKIQVIEKTTVQKWMKDDEYNFEIPLDEVNNLCWRINDEFAIVDSWDITEVSGFAQYLIENEILTYDQGGYEAGKNFDEFWQSIKSKMNES